MAVSNVFDSVHLSSPADLEIVTIQLGCCRDLVRCTSSGADVGFSEGGFLLRRALCAGKIFG